MSGLYLKVKRLNSYAKLPTRAYNSPGIDLYSVEDVQVEDGTTFVRTGISVEIPEGYVGIVKARSGYAKLGLIVGAGVIDPDYRGEIIVVFHYHGNSSIDIKRGDKIAQMLIVPAPLFEIIEVEDLSSTERGERGFGSSGK